MHETCKAVFFIVLGVILALMFLLLVVCSEPNRTVPPSVPVPPTPTGPITVPEKPVPTPHTKPDCATPEPTVRLYTVKPGDTLWGISGSTVSEPFKWREIWKLNKDVVEKPHLIYPGEVLKLPKT